jgi:hypothetical protein
MLSLKPNNEVIRGKSPQQSCTECLHSLESSCHDTRRYWKETGTLADLNEKCNNYYSLEEYKIEHKIW